MSTVTDFILQPAFFISALIVLFAVSVFVIVYFTRRIEKARHELIIADRLKMAEKEDEMDKRELQWKQKVLELEQTLQEKEGWLRQVISEKEDLQKSVSSLQDTLSKCNKELSLQNQMTEGLKGQYDELERDYQRLTSQAEKEMKSETIRERLKIQEPMN